MPNSWQTVLDEIKSSVSDMAYNAFFEKIRFVSDEGGVVTFSVPNSFIRPTIEKKYHKQVLAALKAAGYKCDSFNIVVSEQSQKKDNKRGGIEILPGINNQPSSSTPTQIKDTIGQINIKTPNNGLSPKYRLDNYVVGGNNDVAVGAANAIIEKPGLSYNPFFLYGGSGYGKTHLIQAIGNEIHTRHPEMKVLYVTIEQFYGDFVSSIRNKKLEAFKERYRNLDVLIVDDFQFIQGKIESQNEFFHTFNELYAQNKQVIIAADRLPSQIASVDPRLASRLTQGISIDIQLPDFETRCAIIKTKAEMIGQEIDNATVEYLAQTFNSNIRELEEKLNHTLLLAEIRGVSTSDVIGEIGSTSQLSQHRVSPKQVIDKVAKYYSLSSKDLLGTSRVKDIKNARQIAMYLMNKELELSTVRISNEFKKDHTTVMHSVKVVNDRMKTDFNLREQVSELRSKLYAN